MYAATFFSITNLMTDVVMTVLSSQYFFLIGVLGLLVDEHKHTYQKGNKIIVRFGHIER